LQVNNWNAIAAMAKNHVIGTDGRLPWHIPEDLAWFHAMTEGQTLIVGRKTLESMPNLPQNAYLMLTQDKSYVPAASNVRVIHDLSQVPNRDLAGRGIWICGGSAVYAAALPYCQYLYLTTVKGDFTGDAYFPPFSDTFQLDETLRDNAQLTIARYKNIHHHGGHRLD